MHHRLSFRRLLLATSVLTLGYVTVVGCGGDDEGTPSTNDSGVPEASTADVAPRDAALEARSPEYTGSACQVAADCYGDLDGATLKGDAVCIDRVEKGYCTHKCQTDADCCAVPGECKTGLRQVCAPFESTGEKYCFLSCEPADIGAATDAGASDAGTDGDDYCTGNTSTDFGCRSTGGGNENRKACLPVGIAGDGGKKDSGLLDADVDADANVIP
jgi:hypothetical protein